MHRQSPFPHIHNRRTHRRPSNIAAAAVPLTRDSCSHTATAEGVARPEVTTGIKRGHQRLRFVLAAARRRGRRDRARWQHRPFVIVGYHWRVDGFFRLKRWRPATNAFKEGGYCEQDFAGANFAKRLVSCLPTTRPAARSSAVSTALQLHPAPCAAPGTPAVARCTPAVNAPEPDTYPGHLAADPPSPDAARRTPAAHPFAPATDPCATTADPPAPAADAPEASPST